MVGLKDLLDGRTYTVVELSTANDMNVELTWLKQNLGPPTMEPGDDGKWTAIVLPTMTQPHHTIRYYFFNEDDALHFKLSI